MFPPFILLGRVLQKLFVDQVEEAVLIAPMWPSQAWYPILLWCLIDIPRLLPQTPSLLQDPWANPHPLMERLHLVVWKVSGIHQRSLEFRMSLSSSCVLHGGRALRNRTVPAGDGVVGAVDNISIPWLHL